MVKLLLCILFVAALAVAMLQLRQQRLELGYQAAQLHDQITSQQARLWNQQMQIAVYTAPNAIQRTVQGHHLQMVPLTPLPDGKRAWVDVTREGNAAE